MAKNKVQCPNGHFYNADKYTECPACNLGMTPKSTSRWNHTEPKVKTESNSEFYPKSFASEPKEMYVENIIKPSESVAAYKPTESIYDNRNNGSKTVSYKDNVSNEPDMVVNYQSQEVYMNIQESEVQQRDNPVIQMNSTPSSSLLAAVNEVVSHNDTDDVKTVAVWNPQGGVEPVVGWLVCIKGEYFGQSFNLNTGNNTVGRAMNMDIPLPQEASVSRNKHCVITFEPQNQDFYLQQGESSGLTYLNDTLILMPTKMQEKDRLKLGQAEFLFIPFCKDGFNWNEYI